MTYFFIAGEASGDLHASSLIKAIRSKSPEARFVGLGGDLMAQAGCELVQHYREMAFMGFVAVLKNLGKVRRNFAIAKEALLREQPEALVLIDYPSFNLKMAQFCREQLPTTKIYYYIPPKVWAWKSWRINTICRLSYEVLGIFPFEPQFYQERGYHCHYVGNPTMDAIRAYREQHPEQERSSYIAILPGSRKSEIANCLPTMLAAAEGYPVKIAGAPGVEPAFYDQYAKGLPVVFGDTYRLLSEAQAAIVNSGTATLEAALLGCPQVAVYHLAFPRLVAILRPPFERIVFRLPFFTLPNIILGREAVKELVANDFTLTNVRQELQRLLTDDTWHNHQQSAYAEIRSTLGDKCAAESAAAFIIPKQ